MLVDMSLRDFSAAVAAKTSTPGGGSVAAYASTLGTALGTMAIRYSDAPDCAQAIPALDALRARFILLVDRDTEAYSKVTAAYGLPKKTDEDKKARKAAIQAALVDAAKVPLEGMRAVIETLKTLEPLVVHCNKNLASDLASGAHLLRAGLEGCGWNVRINAASFADADLREDLDSEEARLRAECMQLTESILASAARLVSRPLNA
jgi:formiminotetrahydrofolate cyclodeaminase